MGFTTLLVATLRLNYMCNRIFESGFVSHTGISSANSNLKSRFEQSFSHDFTLFVEFYREVWWKYLLHSHLRFYDFMWRNPTYKMMSWYVHQIIWLIDSKLHRILVVYHIRVGRISVLLARNAVEWIVYQKDTKYIHTFKTLGRSGPRAIQVITLAFVRSLKPII